MVWSIRATSQPPNPTLRPTLPALVCPELKFCITWWSIDAKVIVVRKIPGDGPIKTPLLANITCNQDAVPIPGRTGEVTAGTGIKFYWNECESWRWNSCFGTLMEVNDTWKN